MFEKGGMMEKECRHISDLFGLGLI